VTQVKDGLVKRGATWSYIVRVRDPLTGKMKDQWKGGFKTQKEARQARNDARSASDKGTAVAASKITTGQHLSQWLEASETRVRPTTLASYRQHVDNHIVSRIGGERLQQLTPMMIDRMYAELLREGRESKVKVKEGEKKPKGTALSVSTVRRVGATLHKALHDAVKKKLIPFNPCDAAELPKIEKNVDSADELHVWTREELDKFLACVADDRLFAMWRLAATTGMRRGELAGLTRRNVNIDDGTVNVQRARVTVSSADVRESKPKTSHGRRSIPLDNVTTAALAAWCERQQADRDKWPGEWPDHDLLFTLEDGSALHPDYLSRRFRTLVKKAGVPMIRLHDVRHTCATLMLAGGVPVKVVSERLGHSTPAFTMAVYQSILPGMSRDAAQSIFGATKPARHLKVVNA